jgi:thiol:disulfide interchange protein DsbC
MKVKRFLSTALLCFIAVLANPLGAQVARTEQSVDAIRSQLAKRIPSENIRDIRASLTFPGMFEAVTGNEMIFFNADLKTIIVGVAVDFLTGENITEARIKELSKIDVTILPVSSAIKTVRGNGERVLHVFSDPDCLFCARLETNLSAVNNVTIYTYLFPISQLHPDALRKSSLLLCADSPATAWHAWWTSKNLPSHDRTQCASTIEAIVSLAKKIGVSGTPTLFSADGRRAVGALPTEQINTFLDNTKSR